MFIIKHKKIFISISIFLAVASIALLAVFGLKLGIDFKGGAQLEVNYADGRPEQELVTEKIKTLNIGEALVQPAGETEYSIKTRDLTEVEHQSLLKALSFDGKNKVEEKSFNSIGPSVGKELSRKAIIAIILVSLGIIFFIAYAFRKVSQPISSWRYGFIAIVTLLHDVAIPVGLFTLLSHFQGVEVDTLFVVAVLTVLGLSVSDTIVVFDRIRENLKNHVSSDFKETVGKSLEQTYARSINTSLTVILAVLALFFFGPESTKYFALMLAVGMFFGTYSSIFLASPLLVAVEEWQMKKKLKAKKK
jgi:preprotein translocase subunit SecF